MIATCLNQPDSYRFTLDGSAELEQRLTRLCERIRRAVLQIVPPPKLEALALGGGYGRGQGGVLMTDMGCAPYNDLEFYVFLRGSHLFNDLKYRSPFRALGESLSPEAGLHVEFKVDSLTKLRSSPVSIFSYDLLSGHQIIFGCPTAFDGCEHHLDSSKIPMVEATRLLLNRCSGLLLVKELLLKESLSPEESDFIGRNIAKAKLALGDALLAAGGKYHWDCLERARRLRQVKLPESEPLLLKAVEHHAAGVQFKLHPTRATASIEVFKKLHAELTELALTEWLWIENQRLNADFSTLREYAFSAVDKCAGNSRWRNLLLNIKTFGARATIDRKAPRYPRERLFNTLPLLLGNSAAATEPDTRQHLQRQLHTQVDDWHGFVAAYKQIWTCYG